MTEQRSDYTLRYFLFLLGKLKTCIILAFIFSFLGFPVAAAATSQYENKSVQTILAALAIVSMLGSLAISFTAPLIVRSYLFTRAAADNILSLPLTSFQRYICEAGASLASFSVPCALSLPLTALLDEFGSVLGVAVMTLMALLMFWALNLFLSGACGRLAEAILYPVAFNLVLPMFTLLASYLAKANAFGLELYFISIFGTALNASSLISPAGCLLYFFMAYPQWERIMLVAPVYALIFVALGYLVYRKRPVENIGQPFVFKRAYTINSVFITVGCIVCYSSVLAMINLRGYGVSTEDLPAAAAVLAVLVLILMLVMEFINCKKVQSLPKFLLKYVGTLAVGILLSFGLYMSEGFGESFYIPAADETAYISGSLWAHNSDIVSPLFFCADGGNELAEQLRSEHRRIVDKHDRAAGRYELEFRYTLKNGRTVNRRYIAELPDDLAQRLIENPDHRYSELLNFEMTHIEEGQNAVYPNDHSSVILQNFYTGDEYLFALGIDYAELRAALTEDLKNDVSFGSHAEAPLGTLIIGQIYTGSEGDALPTGAKDVIWLGTTANYVIYDSYVNTTAYLKKYGKVPDASEALEDVIAADGLISVVRYPISCPQTAAPLRVNGSSYEGAQAVFISGDELKEAASAAVCVSGTHDYVYYLRAGVPLFFDSNGSYGVDDEMLPQLIESGMVGEKFRVDPNYTELVYPRGSSFEQAVNEAHYPLLERFFSDRYVFGIPQKGEESNG